MQRSVFTRMKWARSCEGVAEVIMTAMLSHCLVISTSRQMKIAICRAREKEGDWGLKSPHTLPRTSYSPGTKGQTGERVHFI